MPERSLLERLVVQVNGDNLVGIENALAKETGFLKGPVTNLYELFRYSCTNGLVVGYRTGKIVADSEKAQEALQRIVQSVLSRSLADRVVIGSDEAGKGERLGPLVVAAVALNRDQRAYLQSIGVMDSKDLTATKIARLSILIQNNSVSHTVITIIPTKFNQLFLKLKEEGKTLNDMLACAHAKAIEDARKKIPDTEVEIVIDEFDRVRTEGRIRRIDSLRGVNLIQKHGAEKLEVAVAAASIIARRKVDLWVAKESKAQGIDLKSLSDEEAKRRDDAGELFKLSYLHQ